jgi:hypothetical protein
MGILFSSPVSLALQVLGHFFTKIPTKYDAEGEGSNAGTHSQLKFAVDPSASHSVPAGPSMSHHSTTNLTRSSAAPKKRKNRADKRQMR